MTPENNSPGVHALDRLGFVSELKDANLLMISEGMTCTPPANATHHGISPHMLMDIPFGMYGTAPENADSIIGFHKAREVFTTGTMGEITPVKETDGRKRTDRSSSDGRKRYSLAFTN